LFGEVVVCKDEEQSVCYWTGGEK